MPSDTHGLLHWLPAGFGWTCAGVFLVIVLVDALLGPTAEYLNVYEIARRTLAPMLPERAPTYILGQAALGRWALLVGWIASAAETALIAALLRGAWRWLGC